MSDGKPNLLTFDRRPDDYKHWSLSCDGPIATIAMDVQEDGGLRPDYKLKLNSYDLGVDIELHDALQRVRFEHPEVRALVITSAKERTFCSGANIYMLGTSSHAWKVNFCKFTNETRNGIEDLSANSGVKTIAACNGATAGGGYELALACDEIALIDDRSSSVSLPEVPLLGVLPGTGGLTRLVDKRKVRRDLADVFCTTAEGVRGQRAKDWKLVDHVFPPSEFAARVKARAQELAALSDRPEEAKGVALTPLERTIDDDGYHYTHVDAAIDPARRTATITVKAPAALPEDLDGILAAGAGWWPLAMARELDDAILMLRQNNPELGTLLLRTRGEAEKVLAADAQLLAHGDNWFVRETVNFLRRTLSRLDVSSRSLFAIIDPGSCFAGTLMELALAADRSFMLDDQEAPEAAPAIILGEVNFGLYVMANGLSRLEERFMGEEKAIAAVREKSGQALKPADALALGLVTFAPDEIDWEDEIRIAVEERASLSPDALTGMEASLRFGGRETMDTKIFGRLTAWQNWVFSRPNAVGDKGALKVYGTGSKPKFDWERV